MPDTIISLTNSLLKNPVRISITPKSLIFGAAVGAFVGTVYSRAIIGSLIGAIIGGLGGCIVDLVQVKVLGKKK